MSFNSHLTTFDQAVLTAVKRVPKGRVVTYASLASAIGRSRAARAVGQALSKNPHLVTVPCHRVVRSGGMLGGYRQGARQKKKLLIGEGVSVTSSFKIKNFSNVEYYWQ